MRMTRAAVAVGLAVVILIAYRGTGWRGTEVNAGDPEYQPPSTCPDGKPCYKQVPKTGCCHGQSNPCSGTPPCNPSYFEIGSQSYQGTEATAEPGTCANGWDTSSDCCTGYQCEAKNGVCAQGALSKWQVPIANLIGGASCNEEQN